MKIHKNILTLSDVLSIINIIVLISAGLAGYFFVERVKLQFEEIRNNREKAELISLKAKMISEIRPKVVVTYHYKGNSPSKYSKIAPFEVVIKNNGQHHIFLTGAKTSNYDNYVKTKDGRDIDATSREKHVRLIDHGQGIAPGEQHIANVAFFFKEEVDVTEFTGSYSVNVTTDPLMLDVIKDIFPKDYSFDKINELATYKAETRLNIKFASKD